MKTSRKGTRLNDAQYFRQPLPHKRKKMMTMFLLPRTSDLQVNHLFLTESLLNDPTFKVKDHKTLDVKQSSIEMALFSCISDSSISKEKLSKGTYKEIDVETESFPSNVSVLYETKYTPEKQILFEENLPLTPSGKERNESRKIDENSHEIHQALEEKIKHAGRWKDNRFRQTIFQFFSKILGKRDAAFARENISNKNRFLGTTANRSKRNERKRRNNRTICITKNLDQYKAHGGEKMPKKDESREEAVSILVRQIQRTRDKNLRVTLLEQELCARLPTGNTLRDKMLGESLASRQLSSPFC